MVLMVLVLVGVEARVLLQGAPSSHRLEVLHPEDSVGLAGAPKPAAPGPGWPPACGGGSWQSSGEAETEAGPPAEPVLASQPPLRWPFFLAAADPDATAAPAVASAAAGGVSAGGDGSSRHCQGWLPLECCCCSCCGGGPDPPAASAPAAAASSCIVSIC